MNIVSTVRLVRKPELKTSKAGKQYASALGVAGNALAGREESSDLLVRLSIFDADRFDQLTALDRGSILAVEGRAEIEVYIDRNGKPAASLSVLVSRCLTGRTSRRSRRPESGAEQHVSSQSGDAAGSDDNEFADDSLDDVALACGVRP